MIAFRFNKYFLPFLLLLLLSSWKGAAVLGQQQQQQQSLITAKCRSCLDFREDVLSGLLDKKRKCRKECQSKTDLDPACDKKCCKKICGSKNNAFKACKKAKYCTKNDDPSATLYPTEAPPTSNPPTPPPPLKKTVRAIYNCLNCIANACTKGSYVGNDCPPNNNNKCGSPDNPCTCRILAVETIDNDGATTTYGEMFELRVLQVDYITDDVGGPNDAAVTDTDTTTTVEETVFLEAYPYGAIPDVCGDTVLA